MVGDATGQVTSPAPPHASDESLSAVSAWLRQRLRIPLSTYRCQFQPGFTFDAAAALVPYLSSLGVTDLYSSPFLKATPGTRHGYDICNHNELNPELGSLGAFEAFTAALAAHGVGQIVDFVPNHMGVDPRTNEWWRDVLENGPSSVFAEFFDIAWDPVKPELKNKVLLPILTDQYGVVLERGDLRLVFEAGGLGVTYGELRLPINPGHYPLVFRRDLDALQAALGEGHPDLVEFLSILTSLQNLPPQTELDRNLMVERHREKEVARARLTRLAGQSTPIAAHVAKAVQTFAGVPGIPLSFDMLHGLLEAQAYRLAYWRTAADEINYRRFFDINELAALRMENPRVFGATHTLLLRLIQEQKVTGVRVDHPDGLFDPAEYFDRLQEAAMLAMARDLPGDICPPDRRDDILHAMRAEERAEGRIGPLTRPLYVVAEKILSPGEALPEGWAIHGTSGYDFLNDVNGVFVDGGNGVRLRRIHARVTGLREPFGEVVHQSKRLIILTAMASELAVLAHDLNKLSERSRRWRDFTLNSFRRVLVDFVAALPVYRTYVNAAGASASDRDAIDTAIREARRRNPAIAASIFEFLRGILLPHEPNPAARASVDDLPERERLAFAMRLQQYTGPVQAKGVEDTTFYRHSVFLSLNEVGGSPARLGRTVDEFHRANRRRLDDWPLQMLATSTHDTKRGEDARARLNVLSEIPDEWRRAVSRWMRVNSTARTIVDGEPAPDRNDEYLFYQALIGAWPAGAPEAGESMAAPPGLVDRLLAYMLKAVREAKVHTSWINENHAYEQAVVRFIQQALAGRTAPRFLALFVPFLRRIARPGMVNALSQLTLKLASPGVADFYQGTELWDFSLVDPDNRRPVDYATRRQMMSELAPWVDRALDVHAPGDVDDSNAGLASAVAGWLSHWEDGRIKMFVTATGLRLRRRNPQLFVEGDYVPLVVDGPSGHRLVAFARRHGSDVLVAIAPRLTTALTTADRVLPLGTDAWLDTRVVLPVDVGRRVFRHVFTGAAIVPAATAVEPALSAADVLQTCPVALLWARTE